MQRYGFASAPISNGGYNNYFIIEDSLYHQTGCENLYQDRFFFIFQHFNAIHTFFYFVCKKIDSSPSLIFLFLHNIP